MATSEGPRQLLAARKPGQPPGAASNLGQPERLHLGRPGRVESASVAPGMVGGHGDGHEAAEPRVGAAGMANQLGWLPPVRPQQRDDGQQGGLALPVEQSHLGRGQQADGVVDELVLAPLHGGGTQLKQAPHLLAPCEEALVRRVSWASVPRPAPRPPARLRARRFAFAARRSRFCTHRPTVRSGCHRVADGAEPPHAPGWARLSARGSATGLSCALPALAGLESLGFVAVLAVSGPTEFGAGWIGEGGPAMGSSSRVHVLALAAVLALPAGLLAGPITAAPAGAATS